MEEEKFNCSECSKDFSSGEALGMHNSAKHSLSKNKEKPKNKKSSKGVFKWIFLGLTLVVLFYYGFSWIMTGASIDNIPVSEMNIVSHSNLAMHIHSDLSIVIDGVETAIPPNVGVSQGVMRPLHTHDSSGELHIEGPFRRDFMVGEFFEIWGRTFNSTCIFEHCTNEGELRMYVNGVENLELSDYVMKDHDIIRIQYGSNS